MDIPTNELLPDISSTSNIILLTETSTVNENSSPQVNLNMIANDIPSVLNSAVVTVSEISSLQLD